MMQNLRYVIFMLMAMVAVAIRADSSFVVVDSETKVPLPAASLFDINDNSAGMCDVNGRSPQLSDSDYPLTVRYLGYDDAFVVAPVDTVFLHENYTQLTEVEVSGNKPKLLHIIAYVREYSTLTTYTDTIFMYREKMTDFMLPPNRRIRFDGWTQPRLLKSKSYYRFTDICGRDSVSNSCNNHFSWTDWVGINGNVLIPMGLKGVDEATDTVHGRYGASEIWTKRGDRINVSVDVLADRGERKWVPTLENFFDSGLQFDNMRMNFSFYNYDSDSVSALDLAAYSYTIESRGRGRDMFRFNRTDEPVFVNTYAEVYIVDREFITLKEARRWEKHKYDKYLLERLVPKDIPELSPSIQLLVERVNTTDYDNRRQHLAIDPRIGMWRDKPKRGQTFGDRVLTMFKGLTGISDYKYNKNMKKTWKDFKNR